jgi:hypothetical protein
MGKEIVIIGGVAAGPKAATRAGDLPVRNLAPLRKNPI